MNFEKAKHPDFKDVNVTYSNTSTPLTGGVKGLERYLRDEGLLPTPPGLTPRGEPMPQTVPELQYLLNLYGEKIEEDKETIAKLKQRINVLEQKLNNERNPNRI